MKEEILRFLNSNHEVSLGTLKQGAPYVSASGSIEHQGKLYLLLSALAQHTKNLEQDKRASLLVIENSSAPVHEKKRVSLTGSLEKASSDQRDALKAEYLKVFPKSEMFFTLPDFHFYEFKITEAAWIGGFGKAQTIIW